MLDKSQKTMIRMFNAIASHYDLMNDVMTGFSHRFTRKMAIKLSNFKPGQKALDLATGTGDFAFQLYNQADGKSKVIGVDISDRMLAVAKFRSKKVGINGDITFQLADMNELPYKDNTFDMCSIGYGIRNVHDPLKVLKEIARVTKRNGYLLIVEANPPKNRFSKNLAHFYFHKIVPLIAKFISPDGDAYNYLVDSISQFPAAPKFLKMILLFRTHKENNIFLVVVAAMVGLYLIWMKT